jgi:hypothetical protein
MFLVRGYPEKGCFTSPVRGDPEEGYSLAIFIVSGPE